MCIVNILLYFDASNFMVRAILDAARATMREQGVAALSMQELA